MADRKASPNCRLRTVDRSSVMTSLLIFVAPNHRTTRRQSGRFANEATRLDKSNFIVRLARQRIGPFTDTCTPRHDIS
jgi:hypothetical protein